MKLLSGILPLALAGDQWTPAYKEGHDGKKRAFVNTKRGDVGLGSA